MGMIPPPPQIQKQKKQTPASVLLLTLQIIQETNQKTIRLNGHYSSIRFLTKAQIIKGINQGQIRSDKSLLGRQNTALLLRIQLNDLALDEGALLHFHLDERIRQRHIARMHLRYKPADELAEHDIDAAILVHAAHLALHHLSQRWVIAKKK